MHKNMKAWDIPDFCAFVFFYALVIYRKLENDDFLKGGGIQHFMIFFVTKMIFFYYDCFPDNDFPSFSNS